MRSTLLTLSRISMLFVFTSVFGFSLLTLSNASMVFSHLSVAWLQLAFFVSTAGLFALARGLK